MQIVGISDMHGQLPKETCPECDLLVIAGDICPDYRDINKQAEWLDKEFRDWLKAQPAKKILGTWGNHDFIGQRGGYPDDLPWELVVDGEVEYQGRRIYLTPWVPALPRWAYSFNGDIPVEKCAEIPEGLDILVTHGPPYHYCDEVPRYGSVGSQTLFKRLCEAKPKVTITGHIHEARGASYAVWQGWVFNVASVDGQYEPYQERYTLIEGFSDECRSDE
jgi:Icc-related predicted phosphoesterase